MQEARQLAKSGGLVLGNKLLRGLHWQQTCCLLSVARPATLPPLSSFISTGITASLVEQVSGELTWECGAEGGRCALSSNALPTGGTEADCDISECTTKSGPITGTGCAPQTQQSGLLPPAGIHADLSPLPTLSAPTALLCYRAC